MAKGYFEHSPEHSIAALEGRYSGAKKHQKKIKIVPSGMGGQESWNKRIAMRVPKTPSYEIEVPEGGRLFKLGNGVEVVAWYEKTRNAFRHLAVAYKWNPETQHWDEVYRTKIPYQNRTWESYEYQSVLEKAIDGINSNEIVLNAEEKAKAMDLARGKFENEERERVNKQFGQVAAIAQLGEVFGNTPKEKNDWKARMIKAGFGEGVQIPEDWDTLSEEEKGKRLDKVIAFMKEKK
jgi:hypothetical protein